MSQSLLIKIFIITSVSLFFVILFVLPIKIPYSFSAIGRLNVAEEWIILKGRDGQLITMLKDLRTGLSKNYSVTEFERGDNARFTFDPNIKVGMTISKSDIIGSIFSNELEIRLTSLRGKLIVAEALLKQNLSGEKESLIKEAEENLVYLRKKAEVDKRIYLRQEKLFEKNLISEEEYEVYKNTSELNSIEIAIAEAQLHSISSGEKSEQINFIKAQITALKSEISMLEKKADNFIFTSPINGFVKSLQVGDTLLVIADSSQYVLTVQVPLEKYNYISCVPGAIVTIPFHNKIAAATLGSINNSVQYLSSKPVVIGTAIVSESSNDFMPGLLVKCDIECGEIEIAEYIKRIFNSEIF
jgi:hypothetical protein